MYSEHRSKAFPPARRHAALDHESTRSSLLLRTSLAAAHHDLSDIDYSKCLNYMPIAQEALTNNIDTTSERPDNARFQRGRRHTLFPCHPSPPPPSSWSDGEMLRAWQADTTTHWKSSSSSRLQVSWLPTRDSAANSDCCKTDLSQDPSFNKNDIRWKRSEQQLPLSVFIGNIPKDVTADMLRRVVQLKGTATEIVCDYRPGCWLTAFVTYSSYCETVKTIEFLSNKRAFKNAYHHRLVCCAAPPPPPSLCCGTQSPQKSSANSHLQAFIPKFTTEFEESSNLKRPTSRFSLLKDGPAGANLFIYGIPSDWTEVTLMRLCQEFGYIVGIRVPGAPGEANTIETVHLSATGTQRLNKGFGFVSYDSTESSVRALEALSGRQFLGKLLNIQLKLGEQLSSISPSNSIDSGYRSPKGNLVNTSVAQGGKVLSDERGSSKTHQNYLNRASPRPGDRFKTRRTDWIPSHTSSCIDRNKFVNVTGENVSEDEIIVTHKTASCSRSSMLNVHPPPHQRQQQQHSLSERVEEPWAENVSQGGLINSLIQMLSPTPIINKQSQPSFINQMSEIANDQSLLENDHPQPRSFEPSIQFPDTFHEQSESELPSLVGSLLYQLQRVSVSQCGGKAKEEYPSEQKCYSAGSLFCSPIEYHLNMP